MSKRLDMLPLHALTDMFGMGFSYAKSVCDVFVRFASLLSNGANFSYLLLIKLGRWMTLSKRVSLGKHLVLHIVSIRSKPQMTRVYASWIMTAMQNVQIFFNWTFKDNKCCTVGSCPFSFQVKCTITLFISICHPFPALALFFRYMDFAEKMLLNSIWGSVSNLCFKLCSTVFRATTLFVLPCEKRLLAEWTYTGQAPTIPLLHAFTIITQIIGAAMRTAFLGTSLWVKRFLTKGAIHRVFSTLHESNLRLLVRNPQMVAWQPVRNGFSGATLSTPRASIQEVAA